MFGRHSRRLRERWNRGGKPLTPEQLAARARWQERWNLPIVLAAVVPLFATSPQNRVAELAIGLGSWVIFAVDLVVQRRIVPDYLRRRNGKMDLAIVALTFPFYLLPGVGGTTAILVLARLARVARLLVATAGLRRFAARLGKVVVFAGLIVLVASFVAYWAEHPTNPEYATFRDAIWWGVVTLTTVGYGDIVPETDTGRFAGMAIMFTGVATIGILAGSLASLFHLDEQKRAPQRPESGEPRPLHEELAALRDDVQEVERRLGRLADRAEAQKIPAASA